MTLHGTRDRCSCTAIRQAARHVSRFYDEALAPVGLGVNQFAVLNRIARDAPPTIGELADRLVMDRSTLGHLLRPLQRRGWVTIVPAPANRRRREVGLTASGKAVLAAGRPLWARAQARFGETIGAADAAALNALMARIAAADFRIARTPKDAAPRP